MDYPTYKIIHLVGLGALTLGVGGMMAGGPNRKPFAILQGIALLVMLVSGFGLLAKLHLGFPHFAMVKTALWVVIGLTPMILRRLGAPAIVGILVSLTLVGVMAWLGVVKPALW
jgi:hypothetical protein